MLSEWLPSSTLSEVMSVSYALTTSTVVPVWRIAPSSSHTTQLQMPRLWLS
jgi:hypothetical protein